MKTIFHNQTDTILRFDRGEDVIAALAEWAREHSLGGASITALGACSEVDLAYYHLSQKEYQVQTFTGDREIVGLVGNIATKGNGDFVVHAHGSFADDSYAVIAGHVQRLVVSATCEVSVRIMPQAVVRAHDEQTGLPLLSV